MKQTNTILALLFGFICHSQTAIQSVNSGSIIALNSSISVGEIVVVPVNQLQSNSGIIGILAQINNQTLEVSQFEIDSKIIVYPNPTVAKLFFESDENLSSETIFISDSLGKIIDKKTLSSDNSLDLSAFSNGIYWITFSNTKFKKFQIIKK